ncbi:Histone-lysine N-methyltransferase, H3 lysine-36 specific [Candida viswanathii]|uniref:Histone-lysine N-methyltransferase, H3 lysine-36 specific n=1 Tax=Candida viswanathii TaxID=5486 RepID=A0A367XP94_9ASCO|nr:Histone-lysine N-methyltransferase, H3 lysine-36 specific [Candida viswanathii]
MSTLTPEDSKLSSVEDNPTQDSPTTTTTTTEAQPTSRTASPTKPPRRSPQLFNDVEDKTQEALGTFSEIDACIYQTKTIGAPMKKSNSRRKPEFMTCDCQEEWDGDTQQNLACGEDLNCINRITSVECINLHCTCGNDCQNQRFQRREYSNVSVFQTEMKGYGLKSEEAIGENQFIYEYIGEVIDETSFRKRMVEYDMQNFKHFYFMMLDQNSFIDATKKGSLARFANHSCNPNAYVDKWVVGDKLRMGIFAKRRIEKGEEITFDYNVDRYGAQSQPCYCGEPNCIKFMGGKTQTDAALLLPEVLADALGVTPRQEKQWLKENKARRREQQSDESKINEKFVQSIETGPLNELDVSKVMSALMKCEEVLIIDKLIERIYKTDDSDVNGLLVRFHGYKTMSIVLQDVASKANEGRLQEDKEELVSMILEILIKWPALSKNKISSAQIEEVVQDIEAATSNERIKELSSKLLQKWSVLEMAYRIPKLETVTDVSGFSRSSRSPDASSGTPQQYLQAQSFQQQIPKPQRGDRNYGLPENWFCALDKNTGKYYYYNGQTQQTLWERPAGSLPFLPTGPSSNGKPMNNINMNKTIEAELAEREEEKLQREKQRRLIDLEAKQRHIKEIIEKSKSQNSTPIPETAGKHQNHQQQHHKHRHEHRRREHGHGSEQVLIQWKHLLATYIPNMCSKYESEIGKDNVKGCAKELVAQVAGQELKQHPNTAPPPKLDKKRVKSIKEYVDTYMGKFLVKFRNRKRKHGGETEHEGADHKRVKN